MRINAFLANAAGLSRRKADEFIKAGRVSLNGQTAQLNSQVGEQDKVQLDGQEVRRQHLRYIMLNKPIGYLTTMHDPQGRPTVMDLIGVPQPFKPVGRLDMDTAGLLLLTNDGQLAHKLMHPSHQFTKVYEVKVNDTITDEILNKLSNGVELEDGVTAPAEAKKINGSTIKLTIREGKKRQVRRMIAAVGLELGSLARTEYGPLNLDNLGSGKWRPLSEAEIAALKQA